MSLSTNYLNNALTQCHYDQPLKSYIYQELSQLLQVYPTLTPKPLKSGTNTILELSGTIPVVYNSNTYNIPIKIHFQVSYPNTPPKLIVSPAADMVIKESEYVAKDGVATLEIIRRWNNRLLTAHLLDEAIKCFGLKMPVFKRSAGSQPPPQSIPQNNGGPQGFAGYQNPQPGLNSAGFSPSPYGNPANNPLYNQPGPYPAYSNAQNGPYPPNYNLPPSNYPQNNIPPNIYPQNNIPPNNYPQKSIPPNNYPQNNIPPSNYPPNNNYPGSNNLPPNNYNLPNANIMGPALLNLNNPRTVEPKAQICESQKEKINEFHSKISKELKEEIEILKKESQKLSQKSAENSKEIENFRDQLEKGTVKKELLSASINNTKEWIYTCSNGNFSDMKENELVEYRNIAAKDYLEYFSQERSIEAVIQAIIDAINKSVIPAKDGINFIKQLASDSFMAARLKEKAEKIANQPVGRIN